MGSNTNECNTKDDQCNMQILTLEHNTDIRLVDSSSTDVEARKVKTFAAIYDDIREYKI